VAASTITTAVTLQVDSAPAAGANATITNALAFRALTGTAAGVGVVVQGAASQTGDLLQAQNNSATVLFSLNNNGSVVMGPYGTSTGNTNELRFLELLANGTNYVGFKAPDNIASNVIWTLPSADGSAGQVLSTNASGTLSWTSTVMGASNIIGGAPWTIPYITWEGSTAFTAVGIKGQVLTSNGKAAPSWSAAPSSAGNVFLANNFGGL
jgi:hypothetical protein